MHKAIRGAIKIDTDQTSELFVLAYGIKTVQEKANVHLPVSVSLLTFSAIVYMYISWQR